jgi:hypothetical protein
MPAKHLASTSVRPLHRRTGVKVSIGFFDDIHIPENYLQEPAFFDDSSKEWLWEYEENKLVMDMDGQVRFRVYAVKFNTEPTPAELKNAQGEPRHGHRHIRTAPPACAPMSPCHALRARGGWCTRNAPSVTKVLSSTTVAILYFKVSCYGTVISCTGDGHVWFEHRSAVTCVHAQL